MSQLRIPLFQIWIAHVKAWLERRPEEMFRGTEQIAALAVFDDPEAIFQEAWLLCDIGEHAKGLSFLERSIGRGYFVSPTLAKSPQFDALRGEPAFQSLLTDAEAGRQRALAAFQQAGGDRLLGTCC